MRMHLPRFALLFGSLLLLAACRGVTPREEDSFYTLRDEIPLVAQSGYDASWSPDGKYLLLAAPEPPSFKPQFFVDRALFVLAVASGQLYQLPRRGYHPLWSPAGSALLVNSGDVMDGTFTQWLYQPAHPGITVAVAGYPAVPTMWLNDGRLVYAMDDGLVTSQLPLTALANGTDTIALPSPQHWFADDDEPVAQAWPSPAGNAILHLQQSGNSDYLLSMVQPNGAVQQFATRPDGLGVCCVWSPDGGQLVFSSFAPDYGLYIVDATGQNRRLLVPEAAVGDGRFVAMTFAPDGKTLAFTWQRGDEAYFQDTQLYLVDLDGHNLRQLTANGSGSHQWPQWSPQGDTILAQRAVSNGFALWLTRLAPSKETALTTVTLPPLDGTAHRDPSRVAIPGEDFVLLDQATCPQRIDLVLLKSTAETQWVSFPLDMQTEPASLHRAGLPLRRLTMQATSAESTWQTVDTTSQPPRLRALHWTRPDRRWNQPAAVQFDGIAASLLEPVTITASAMPVVLGKLSCAPAQAVTIRGNSGWLLQQQTIAGSGWPAVNTLIWREDDAYWRISALDPSAGGDYTAADLLHMANEALATFDLPSNRWQPLVE